MAKDLIVLLEEHVALHAQHEMSVEKLASQIGPRTTAAKLWLIGAWLVLMAHTAWMVLHLVVTH